MDEDLFHQTAACLTHIYGSKNYNIIKACTKVSNKSDNSSDEDLRSDTSSDFSAMISLPST